LGRSHQATPIFTRPVRLQPSRGENKRAKLLTIPLSLLSLFSHTYHIRVHSKPQQEEETTIIMGETKRAQKNAKTELDEKLKLAQPDRQILEDLAVACAKDPSPDNTFQYAFCLSKSSERSELRYAVTILDGLVKEGYEHQVDSMLGAAYALYLLEEYDKARVRMVLLTIDTSSDDNH
jgi:hypothetical protein